MKPSSRTPDGDDFVCRVCGVQFTIAKSLAGDACCPDCNTVAWTGDQYGQRKWHADYRNVPDDALEAARQIVELINNEDTSRPISDDGINAELRKLGHQIRRRQVSKLRKLVGIPSSRRRRSAG